MTECVLDDEIILEREELCVGNYGNSVAIDCGIGGYTADFGTGAVVKVEVEVMHLATLSRRGKDGVGVVS